MSEKLGRLRISNFAYASSLGDDPVEPFRLPNRSEQLSKAIITPPAPFSGSATFQSDGRTSGTWTGDLAVRLPGLPSTPLTGGGTEAGLCAGRAGCTKTLPPELQPVLEAPPGVITTVSVGK